MEIPSSHWTSPELAAWLTSAFIDRHHEQYGYVLENEAKVLLASLRLKLVYQPWRNSRVDGLKTGSMTTEGPVLTSYGATLVYREAGKRRPYLMEAISALRLRQSKSALLHH